MTIWLKTSMKFGLAMQSSSYQCSYWWTWRVTPKEGVIPCNACWAERVVAEARTVTLLQKMKVTHWDWQSNTFEELWNPNAWSLLISTISLFWTALIEREISVYPYTTNILPFVTNNKIHSLTNNKHADIIPFSWGDHLLPIPFSNCINLSAMEVERSL